jgi:hypothetical protein
MFRSSGATGQLTSPLILGLALLGPLVSGITRADESPPTVLQSPSDRIPINRPLRLTLSEAELLSIIARHQPGTINAVESQLEEILVTAPTELLPMRDTSQEVWGGIAAPVWALLHPTQAWRIFLPIPPE